MPAIEAIAIGCSMGGMSALKRLLGALDPQLPAAVIVCSHTGSSSVDLLCELLARHSALPVLEARERCPIRAGMVHVAPSGYHLLVEHDRHFALSVDAPECFSRPSIDALFASAAGAYGAALVGLVLTGASPDGARGLADIRNHGGVAIVQEPADAQAPTMPLAALELAGADHCLPLARIAPLLNRLCLT